MTKVPKRNQSPAAAINATAPKTNPISTLADVAAPVLLDPGAVPVAVLEPETVELPDEEPDDDGEEDEGVLIGAVFAAAWKSAAVWPVAGGLTAKTIPALQSWLAYE